MSAGMSPELTPHPPPDEDEAASGKYKRYFIPHTGRLLVILHCLFSVYKDLHLNLACLLRVNAHIIRVDSSLEVQEVSS